MGGEVVVDYALKFKKQATQSLWVAGYSHDVMGYIPSRRVWNEEATKAEAPWCITDNPLAGRMQSKNKSAKSSNPG